MKMKAKFSLLFTLFAFLPIFFFGSYQGYNQYKNLLNKAKTDLSYDLMKREEALQKYFSGNAADIGFISQTNEVLKLLEAFEMEDMDEIEYWSDALKESLVAFSNNRKVFTEILFTEKGAISGFEVF